MKKLFKISYYEIDHGGPMFSIPKFDHEELINATEEEIIKRIKSKTDFLENPYEKASVQEKKSFGFDFISNQGAVSYEEVKITKLTE